jgi:DNA-binding transcriptional MerR regulator
MPKPRQVLNAFTATEVSDVTGLSRVMINYLRRMDFFGPAPAGYGGGRRGRTRFYSYRDLLIARLIQRLREAGVGLVTVKKAVERLRSDRLWREISDDLPSALRWLRTDGKDVFLERPAGFLEYLRSDGQGAFAFVVNVSGLAAEIKEKIPDAEKLENFSLQIRPLRDKPKSAAEARRGTP